MTSIKGYSELLALRHCWADQRNAIELPRHDPLERGAHVGVGVGRDQAKIEAGAFAARFRPQICATWWRMSYPFDEAASGGKHQEVELAMPTELPKVWADRIRVGQVLTSTS
ncbi:MAG: hypothetical protein U0X93_05440 [Anaerolineales bacterium]